ncbi:hypothetical protein D1F64_02745 [Breoghania sp. L-A4]|nr:hypothetical protein D1F64_02745 [Breoghania sp. L-A4]
MVNNRTARVSNTIQAARGALLAEAGVEIAVARLLGDLARPEGAARRVKADATPFLCGLEGEGALAISIQDAAGQLDLNEVSPDLLRAVLGVFATADEAAAITSAVVARRTATPFRLVEELAALPGVGAELYTAVSPHLTLYSGYTGLAQENVAPALRARLAAIDPPGASFFGSLPTDRVFAVNVVARISAQRGYRLETIVHLDPEDPRPYRPLRWRGQGMRAASTGRGGRPGMTLRDLAGPLPPCVVTAF